jgi:MFS family permease
VYVQWSTTVAVYMGGMGVPLSDYGLLWTLNGIGAVALQPAGNAAARLLGPKLHRHLVLSAALYALAFGCLLATGRLWGFVAGIGLLTAGEIFDRPAWPAVMASLAPRGRAGAYQGLLGTMQSAGRMLGPLGGGALYDASRPATVWWVAAACAIVAMGAYGAITGRPARSPRRTRASWPGSA